MKKILIYDDEDKLKNRLKRNLKSLPILEGSFEIDSLDKDLFQTSMQALVERQAAFRKTGTWDGEPPIPLDGLAIFIIDYDLFETDPFLTAEMVAYLARCFSRCGLIVGVNQYGHNSFDLTLKGHLESFADMNVGQEQLHNPNLWGGTAAGFHPWYWPALPNYLNDFEKKVVDIKASLRDAVPVCQVLGIPPKVFELLPRSIGQFLGRKPAKTTFRQFVVESGNGLRPKDRKVRYLSDEVIARVGAARISKWLERIVWPGQDILVDAPHLVSRYPSLISGDIERIEAWNGTARLVSNDELGLSEVIEQFRYKRGHWLSRPAWFWDELREYEKIVEVSEPWKVERPAWVFCEDASEFYKDGYREFVADVESPFARRYVRRFEGIDYRPAFRFSL